jgi:hypothetical protein
MSSPARAPGFYWVREHTYLGLGKPGADERGMGWSGPKVAEWHQDELYSSWEFCGSDEGGMGPGIEVLSERLTPPEAKAEPKVAKTGPKAPPRR